MTIITAEGQTIYFAGDDDVIVDRRVADRRVIDRIVPEQREQDRRQPPPAPRPTVIQSTAKRITSTLSKHEVDDKIMAALDRLFEAADKKYLSDQEAVQALSTEAGLMFAESKPCWMKEEEDKCFQATASS